MQIQEMGQAAKKASRIMMHMPQEAKNKALLYLADWLQENEKAILQSNDLDYRDAQLSNIEPAMLDRLSLHGRISSMADDVRRIAQMPDPLGMRYEESRFANGLKIYKVPTPLGVLGVIYESRPNVTIDVAALALKSGNVVILRGGSEISQTNHKLVEGIRQALHAAGLPRDAVQVITSHERKWVLDMLQMHQFIDVIIPRGGSALHRLCRENSRIPIIVGGTGVCHLFVDDSALLEEAARVVHNAKVQRPTVCNALDTLLVDAKIAPAFLPLAAKKLVADHVFLRADKESFALLQPDFKNHIALSVAQDYCTEWLSLTLSVKVVPGIEHALQHIHDHSTGHSDGILTQNHQHALRFIEQVDSAAVYVNASTRFTDGAQFGLGAEVAISTQKLHARGPMGLPQLTSYKWVIEGQYNVRP